MKDATYDDYCSRVADVAIHIHDHLDLPLTVNDLAARGFLSPFHFQRVFRQVAGENCVRFVRRLRLERAAWQLQNSDASVSEIALRAGFDSPEGFSRAFRKSFASRATCFRESRWLSFWLLTANGTHFSSDRPPSFFPLARKGREAPFTIEDIPAFHVSCRAHFGPPHLIGKSCRVLSEELRQLGYDLRDTPIITFSPKLHGHANTQEIESFVAVVGGVPELANATPAILAGGPHFVARHVGTGPELGDYWMRIWREVLPASGREQADGPCYQVLRMHMYADQPSVILAHIYIPVLSK